jgi:hypothetical protein
MQYIRVCGAGLCASFLLAPPAMAAPKTAALQSRTMAQFVLAPERGKARLGLPVDAGDAPALLARSEAPAAGLSELPGLDDVLALREDLRFLINAAVKDVRKERITLGLHFARTF